MRTTWFTRLILIVTAVGSMAGVAVVAEAVTPMDCGPVSCETAGAMTPYDCGPVGCETGGAMTPLDCGPASCQTGKELIPA